VDDLAELAVERGASREDVVVDAIGPETFTYRELVTTIGRAIGKPRTIISIPPRAGYYLAVLLGKLMGDVVLTRDEVEGLMGGLLSVDAPPAGTTSLTSWAAEHGDRLGTRYSSELARRLR
jgi:NADH dehydrogenase